MAAMEEKCEDACATYYNVPVLEHDYEEISSTGNMEMQSIHHELIYSQPVQSQAAETTPNRSTETLQNQPTETGQNQINEKNKTEKKREATARCIPLAVILLTIVVVVMVVVLMMLIFTGKNRIVFSV